MSNVLDGKPSHPFIGLLVNSVTYVVECLTFRNYENALEGMLMTFNSLKPEHKKSERGVTFRTNLLKLMKFRNTPLGPGWASQMSDHHVAENNALNHDMKNYLKYHGLLNDLQSMLHDWKYYEESTYIGVISAQTLEKTAPSPLATPSPERLPEDLR